MTALNIPLITWCIIVTAMTLIITVNLFRKNHHHAHLHPHLQHIIEIGKEREEIFIPGDNISPTDDAINDVDY